MRIAVILDNIYLVVTGSSTKKILLFEVDEELVTALDEDIISLSDINYLSLWLLGRRVAKIYCDGLENKEKQFLKKTGIEVYPLGSIRGHPILQALLLKDNDEKEG